MSVDPRIQSVPEKAAMKPITHRQPADSPKKPPIIGPSTGPKKGATAKKLIARPRSEAANISAMTPPALVSGEEPKAPAKNRRIIKVYEF